MTLNIRSGHSSDVPACVDIMCAWLAETSWAMFKPEEHQQLMVLWRDLFRNHQVWVAEIENRNLGFCARIGDNISALYVATDARSQGVGKCLLDAAKADRDWITVWAYAKNTRAVAFYRREGLVEIGCEIEEGSNLIDIEHRWTRPARPDS